MIEEWASWKLYLIQAIPPTVITGGILQFFSSFKVASGLDKRSTIQELNIKLNRRSKLTGEIQQFVCVYPYYEPGRSESAGKPAGTMVTLRIYFVNASSLPTSIKNFSLKVKKFGDGDKTTEAPISEEGPIPKSLWDAKMPANFQDTFPNLLDLCKSHDVLSQGQHAQGYLKFALPGLDLSLDEKDLIVLDPVLTITDALGNPHELKINKLARVRPSEKIPGSW